MAKKWSEAQVERSLSARTVTTYTYRCPWRGRDRTLRYVGDCQICGRRTWEADDGENDPRGIMGDHATHALVAADHGMTGPDIPLCAMCGNDYDFYTAAVRNATRNVWTGQHDESECVS